MISDPIALSERVAEWAAVRKLCANATRSFALPGAFFTSTPPDGFFNLPFMLAFAVLDQVLSDLINQGTIPCCGSRAQLGQKMAASQAVLPWQNYLFVESGKMARNALAHDAVLLGDSDCHAFIDAIEVEFRAWRVL